MCIHTLGEVRGFYPRCLGFVVIATCVCVCVCVCVCQIGSPNACLHNEMRLCSKTEKLSGTNLALRYNRLNLKHIRIKKRYTLIAKIIVTPIIPNLEIYTVT